MTSSRKWPTLGYACINMTLSDVKPKKNAIMTNRRMIRRTFDARGIKYASELALKNVKDLEKIVRWNEKHGFKFFRISSELFPWASEYQISDMPDIEEIAKVLKRVGDFATKHGQRLSFHPGPFNKLCSHKENVVKNTIRDLEIHGEIFDLMGLSRTPYNKINIHVGAAYGDKPKALAAFCRNFERLPLSVQTRLTVENDDRPSLYSTQDLYEGVYKQIGIPIVFDYHHHKFCSGEQSEVDALALAVTTWGQIRPVTHYSETKRNADGSDYYKPQAHSDYIFNWIEPHGQDIDIMVEAKCKELAVLRYVKDWFREAEFSEGIVLPKP